MGNFLKGKALLYDEKGLDEIRTSIEPVLKDLMRIKRNRVRYWILKYLREHRGEQFEAIMLYELKSRYRILLTDFLLIAEIKRELNISLNPAERILVEVRKADPWDDTLELAHAPS
jgi:exoribonuclease II